METMAERIENAAELREALDMNKVFDDATKGVKFDEAIRAQMEFQGVEATDEAVDTLVQELSESVEAVEA